MFNQPNSDYNLDETKKQHQSINVQNIRKHDIERALHVIGCTVKAHVHTYPPGCADMLPLMIIRQVVN